MLCAACGGDVGERARQSCGAGGELVKRAVMSDEAGGGRITSATRFVSEIVETDNRCAIILSVTLTIIMTRVVRESGNHTASMATNNILAYRLNIPGENRSADGGDDGLFCRRVSDIDVKILCKMFLI